jgi:elongation factor P
MPVITTNDLKNGMTLELDNELYQAVEFQHVKPGKGHAFVRTTLRGLQNGVVVDRTFRAGEKVERAIIDKRSMQLLYRDGNDYVFMDSESFEQIIIAIPVQQLHGTLIDNCSFHFFSSSKSSIDYYTILQTS